MVMQKLNEYGMQRDCIRAISKKVGIPAGYVLIAAVVLVVAMLYSGFGGLVIQLILSFLYPAYMIFKALKDGDYELLMRFGKYWIVLSCGVALYQIIYWFIPGFPLLGLITIPASIFLIRKKASGAVYLYDTVIQPLLNKFEPTLDYALHSVEGVVEQNKKEANRLKKKAEETTEKLKGKSEEVADKAKDKADEAGDKIKNKAKETKGKLEETGEKAKDKAKETKDKVKGKAKEAKDKTEKTIDKAKNKADEALGETIPTEEVSY